jgi:hypothetical protein
MKKWLFYFISPILLWLLVFTNDYMKHSNIYFSIIVIVFIITAVINILNINKIVKERNSRYWFLVPLWFVVLAVGGAIFLTLYHSIIYGGIQ